MSATLPSSRGQPDLVGRTVSHFRVLEVIGRGGMGVVYKAEDELLRRIVALKVLTESLVAGEENRRRFLREARTAAALTHPNIATIFEIGEMGGTIFIAMELVPGKTLRELMLSEAMPLPPARALALAVEIARALARAHEAGVVHRDLKPENVMVSGDELKLLDFGIAKPLEDRPGDRIDLGSAPTAAMTNEGAIIGTPEYMSPEQLRSEPMGVRSDVFALGVVLYEMLTGHRPFLRPSLLETALAVWKEEPTPIAELAPDVSVEAIAIVARCMAKSPEERFSNAGEVVAALRALTGAAASASRTRPLPKERGKRRPLVAFAVVALVACVPLCVWITSRARHDTSRATPAGAPQPGAPPDEGPYIERSVLVSGSMGDPRISADATVVAYIDEGEAYTLPSRGGPRRKVPPPQPEAQLSGLLGFLPSGEVVTSWQLGDEESLWASLPADGSSRRLGGVRHPCALSPDGKLVLSCLEDGLVVQPLSGEPGVRLTPQGSYDVTGVAWSPSSDAVAYGSRDQARIGTIAIVSVDGRKTQHLITDAALVNKLGYVALAWPRPGAILTSLNRGAGAVLVEVPVDAAVAPGAALREVHRIPDAQVEDLAATGDAIFLEKVRPQDDVFVGSLAPDLSRLAAPLTRLTLDGAHAAPVGWLDDGRALFQSDREGDDALFAQSAPDTPAARLSGEGAAAFSRTADGNLLAWNAGAADAGASCTLERSDGATRETLFTAATDVGGSASVVPCEAEIRCTKRGGCVAKEARAAGARWFAFDLRTGKKGALVYDSSEGARNWDLSPAGDVLAFTSPPSESLAFVTIATGDLHRVHLVGSGVPALMPQFVTYAPDGRHLVVTGMGREREPFVALVTDPAGHARVVATSQEAWFHDPHLDASGVRLEIGERVFAMTMWMLERAR